MSEFVFFLLFLNFGLFILSFILIVISVLKAKNMKVEDQKKNDLPTLSKISYGLALLSFFIMIFISFFLLS